MTSPPSRDPATVRVVASDANWIESEARRQLEQVATLEGMQWAVGMPDLHPGKGSPIGAVFGATRIYPHLVGNDIGCGMGLWQTEHRRARMKLERWVKRLDGLELPWEGDGEACLEAAGVERQDDAASLGTIGGGNHFAELQAVERVEDEATFAALGLDADRLALLVHSGSRGVGEGILSAHVEAHGAGGLDPEEEEGQRYIAQHDRAVRWGAVNRGLIARRFLDAIGGEQAAILDVCHNSVTSAVLDGCTCWLHRKGAAPADEGPVVIPGSRGSFSYLVQPLEVQNETGRSLAHGAGRKWSRSDSKGKLASRFKRKALERTALGSWVICEDPDLLYEEAPQAYKDIDVVVADLIDAQLISVIAVFRPLITYKTRRGSRQRDARRDDRSRERRQKNRGGRRR